MASSVNLLELVTLMLLVLSFHLKAFYASPFMQHQCHDEEKAALLHFKESLAIDESACVDPPASPKTASWKVGGESGEDCCTWDGVECDKDSGHVVGLDLSSSCLYGSIDSNSSLFHLVELRWLNLTHNNFNNSGIPSGIRNLSRLSHLDLSNSSLSGQIPSEILELSKLVSLNLSLNSLKLQNPSLKDLVENLTNLEQLQLTRVNISSKVPQSIASLSSLSILFLRECELYGAFPTEIFQLPNLRLFSVRYNPFLNGYLPEFQWDSQLEKLRLAGTSFSGQLPEAIRDLKSLSVLDVGDCHFSGSIPSSLGNLTKLNYLNLSSNFFSGEIPSSLVNLFQLTSLSLSYNNFSSGTLHWISNLTKLTFLDLAQTNTYGSIPSSFRNLTQLTQLDLHNNKITGQLPLWIGNLNSLIKFDVQKCLFSGLIPSSLGNLTKLNYLDLSSNNFTGQIPSWIGNLTQLIELQLAFNHLHGPIPESIFSLPNLQDLALQSNFFTGTFNFDLLPKLKNLAELKLSGNNLSLLDNHNASITLPKFKVLGLGECNLLGEFPSFLQGQNDLEVLVLRKNKIEGTIPKWFMSLGTKTLWLLGLRGNLLTGFEQPFDVLPWNNLHLLDLSSNNLQGSLPIPPRFISLYDVSKNRLTGEIPPRMCNLPSLEILELSNNNFNGKLPQCLSTVSNVASVLSLRNNSFSGDITLTFSSTCILRVIDFSQNKLKGSIPKSLANCTKLEILNLEQNQINDFFPSWLGALPELRVLILRSNGLHGLLGNPETSTKFSKLQIIDLSNNSFRGNLPIEYFRNCTSMKRVDEEHLVYMQTDTSFQISGYNLSNQYDYTMTMTNKGVMILYEKIQEFLAAIDLSSNMFEGGVPEFIGDLKALNFLNLSNNFLTGPIPPSLGNLKELEALDLSQNKLSGPIPMRFAQLTFLAVFNVSHNFLSGPIPQGNQFDTFDNSSFDANSGLCGMPLSRKCGNGEDSQPAPSTSEEHEESVSLFGFGWKVVAIGYASGFVVGGIIGLFKDTRKCQWLVKSAFARRQQKVPRQGDVAHMPRSWFLSWVSK